MKAEIVVVRGFPSIPNENRLGLRFTGEPEILIILHDSFRSPMVWINPGEITSQRITETCRSAEIPDDLYEQIIEFNRLDSVLSDLKGQYHEYRKKLAEEQKDLPQFKLY